MKHTGDEGGGGTDKKKYKTSCIVLNSLEFPSASCLKLSGWKNRSGEREKRQDKRSFSQTWQRMGMDCSGWG